MRQPEAQTAGWAGAHVVPEGRAALRDKVDSWKADEERSRQLRHPCPRVPWVLESAPAPRAWPCVPAKLSGVQPKLL